MSYEGLMQTDLDNVCALNSQWLKLGGRSDGVGRKLTARRRARLAAAPFLLFSLREHDSEWWAWVLGDRPQQDLLTATPAAGGDRHALQTAALAFLWGLSWRNPYVARLVSGAPLEWCERITAVTLVRLLDGTAGCDVIQPRFTRDSAESLRLFRRGACAPRALRRSAQMAALQTMLTAGNANPQERLRAAACRMTVPQRRVADEL